MHVPGSGILDVGSSILDSACFLLHAGFTVRSGQCVDSGILRVDPKQYVVAHLG